MSFNQIMLAPVLNQLTMVEGNKMMEEAKMGGMTPAMLRGNGGDPESVERAQNAHGDLTSIGHEHAIKHAHIRKTP